MRTRWVTAAAAACLGVALVPIRARGEDKPPDVPPDIAAKFTEHLKHATEMMRPSMDKRMSGEVAEVAKVTGLGSDGVKSLEAAAVKAEDAAQSELTAQCLKHLPKQYAQTSGMPGYQRLSESDYLDALVNGSLGNVSEGRSAGATNQPAWTEALARTLSPEQAATWGKNRAERKAAATREIDHFLDGQAEQYRTMLARPILSQANEIISWLNLPKERAAGITAASKQAVDASLGAWRKSTTESLLDNDDATLKNILKSGGAYYSFTDADALAKGLTDDERARLQATRGEHRTRRVDALGQILVATLDEKIAFTASQRARLEPIAQRLVQTEPAFFPAGDGGSDDYGVSTRSFYKVAAAVRPEEVGPLLDEIQRQHWEEISHRQYTVSDNGEEIPAGAAPLPTPADPAAVGEPEDMERTLSDFLRNRAATRQQESDATLTLQAEDAARVAGLSEPAAARLRTAAHGAAQADMIAWTASMEQTVRSLVQGATPENIQQRLSNANRYYFQRSDPKTQALWNAATSAEMTAPQQAAWRAECDERSRYGDAAVARYLVAEFDRRFALTAEQWNQLVPKLTQAVQDYRSDIERMFSYSGASSWYLMTYSMFLPFNAVPENDLKGLLSHDQWEAWTSSNEYTYSANYWSNIQTTHANRTQQKAKR